MTNKNTKNQENNLSESGSVENNTQVPSPDNNHSLKKLSLYITVFTITCLSIAGVWYNKDEISFVKISKFSTTFYNASVKTLSEKYNSISAAFPDEAIVETTTVSKPADLKNVSSQSIDSKKKIIEKNTEMHPVTILKKVAEKTADIKTKNAVEITDVNNEIKETLITVTDIDIDKALQTKEIIEPANSIDITENNNSVKNTTKTAINQNITEAPYEYTTPPYRFNSPKINRPYNNNPYYNMLTQQRYIFEQNMYMQQQMIQQALNMRAALAEDANRRHQKMLQQAAKWNAQLQKRYNTANAYYHQPVYIN